MSGVIGATHFTIDAGPNNYNVSTWSLENVPPNMWILITCNLTTVGIYPLGDTPCDATIGITSYVDGDNVKHYGSWPEVHAQGISNLQAQISATNCIAQGIVMVFFGIERTPPGIKIAICL
jgi:hypothetical protein